MEKIICPNCYSKNLQITDHKHSLEPIMWYYCKKCDKDYHIFYLQGFRKGLDKSIDYRNKDHK